MQQGGLMKKLVTVLAAAVVMAGTASLALWWQLRAERERGAELAARVAPVPAPLVELPETLLLPVAPPPAAPDAGPAGAPPTPAQTASSGAAPASAAVPPAAPLQQAPAQAVVDPMAGMVHSMMRQLYPDLAAEMGMTDAEASGFLNLYVRQQSETSAQFMDLMAGGAMDPGRRQQRQREMLEKERADEAALRQHLGNKYPRWEEYQSKAEARVTVDELRKSLATVGNPLTDQQADALLTIFAGDATRARQEDRAWMQSDAARNSPNLMVEQLQRQLERQKRWVDLAAPRLDSTQLDHFRSTVEQQTAMLSAMMGMMGGGK